MRKNGFALITVLALLIVISIIIIAAIGFTSNHLILFMQSQHQIECMNIAEAALAYKAYRLDGGNNTSPDVLTYVYDDSANHYSATATVRSYVDGAGDTRWFVHDASSTDPQIGTCPYGNNPVAGPWDSGLVSAVIDNSFRITKWRTGK